MTDLRELYQEMILDHNRSPRNFREIEEADCCVKGENPLCGDQLTLYLKIKDGVVDDASFQGAGCAISTASASMMTEAITGKTVDQVKEMFSEFHEMVTEGVLHNPDDLGKLVVFAGVGEYPVRIKCATLAWHALKAGLQGDEQATTE
jgi:nitrogen fixation NifU-like protein